MKKIRDGKTGFLAALLASVLWLSSGGGAFAQVQIRYWIHEMTTSSMTFDVYNLQNSNTPANQLDVVFQFYTASGTECTVALCGAASPKTISLKGHENKTFEMDASDNLTDCGQGLVGNARCVEGEAIDGHLDDVCAARGQGVDGLGDLRVRLDLRRDL